MYRCFPYWLVLYSILLLKSHTLYLDPWYIRGWERNIALLGKGTPRLLQSTTLIEARIARKTHTGRLLAPIGSCACRKEAATVALLARMDHTTARNL